MTPRRHETAVLANEPVRFYKIVALTFLVLTFILLGVIITLSSKKATITVITRAEPVEATTSLEVEKGKENVAKLVWTEVELVKSYKPTASKEEASIAQGKVVLYNETDYDQPLVATTRLLSPEGILFRLKTKVLVPAKGSVEAEVYADKSGKENEIGPTKFTIPGLSETLQKVIYAQSSAPMVGGVKTIGVLTKEELDQARVSFQETLKEAGKKELGDWEANNWGAVYEVVGPEAVASAAVGDEVDEFTLTNKVKVVAVAYDQKPIVELAKKELNRRLVSEAELITSYNEEPVVSLDIFDLEAGTAKLKVFYSGLVELNPESKQLQKVMFLGKTKDEIRRYLLALDHVQGVEIKFSPAWMRTVPHVLDHISVVVRSIE